MNNSLDPENGMVKSQKKSSDYTTATVYVREDDQDWGSAGMNDIEQEYDTIR